MAPPDLQQLARDAYAGSKDAQYRLGQRYELGTGVGKDVRRALSLYRAAARDDGGAIWVRVPRSGPAAAHLELFDRPLNPGVAAAKVRLQQLAGHGD